jgi:hypothetical protein
MRMLLSLSRSSSSKYLPSTFGHERLSDNFADILEVLIKGSSCYDTYSNKHSMSPDKWRDIDERHMKALYKVS